MIYWKDFILDDVIGPYLDIGRAEQPKDRGMESRSGVMEDAIQETRQERRPARMVGHASLDLIKPGMEAGRGKIIPRLRRGER